VLQLELHLARPPEWPAAVLRKAQWLRMKYKIDV
jgi:hypothetical protein